MSKERFETGAQRDSQDGKPRMDLIDAIWLEDVAGVLRHEKRWSHFLYLNALTSPLKAPRSRQNAAARTAAQVMADEYDLPEVAVKDRGIGPIPYGAAERLGHLLAKGAAHYGADNWRKGIPLYRIVASLHRHYWQWLDGQEDEDHFAAVLFNCMASYYVLRQVEAGELPESLLEPEGTTYKDGTLQFWTELGNVIWCEPEAQVPVQNEVVPQDQNIPCFYLAEDGVTCCNGRCVLVECHHKQERFGTCIFYKPLALPEVYEECKTCRFLSATNCCTNAFELIGKGKDWWQDPAHVSSGFGQHCRNRKAKDSDHD
jgi:hypothetical protein